MFCGANGYTLVTMNITIPDEAVRGILETPEQARVELAVFLYAAGRATMGRAKKIAGLTQLEMQRELSLRKVPMNYSMADYESDMRTIQTIPHRAMHKL